MRMKRGFGSVLPNRRRMAPLSLLLALATCVMLLPAAHAQISATVNGTVVDPTGAVIPGASVILTNDATRDKRTSVSNGEGYFAFPALLTGSYSLRIEARGFNAYEQHGIALSAGDLRKLPNLVMTVGDAGQTVTVEANAQIINVENGQRAALLDNKDIQQLALQGRDVTELLKVLPGVTMTASGVSNNAAFDPTVASAASSAVGNGLNANGAPNRGGTSQLSDGVDVDDPGCDCSSIGILNPDMVQEVSVQTSNFGADAPRGPVVINSVSKSGTAEYHGEGYLYARNDVLNANDWQSNHRGDPRGAAHFYYPGGNVGGPLPFTHKKVLGWVGYERFLQNTGNANRLKSYIPTPDMMAGNFTNTAANVNFCGGNLDSAKTNGCNDLTGTVLPDGTVIGQGTRAPGIIPAEFLDPASKALAAFWPKANVANPAGDNGYNYDQVIPGTHNGYVFRARVDYNMSDKTSFFISYQYAQDSAPSQGNGAHIYWTPGNSVPYPGGGLVSSFYSKALAGHFTHVFSPTLTNEFIASWGFGNFPVGPTDATAAYRSKLGYPVAGNTTTAYGAPANYGTIYNAGSKLIPSYSSAGTLTFPDFSEADIFETASGKYLVKKEMPAFSDDLTKVIKTHTIKTGFYAENVDNIQGAFGMAPNGNIGSFNAGGNLQPNLVTGAKIGSPNNPTANFLTGTVTSYNETNQALVSDIAYQTFSVYGDDSWKASNRLNVEYGVRFDHIGHWYDRQGNGLAVWIPSLVASDFASGKPNPGAYWHGINPGIPKSGQPDRFLLVSPRFGISYDVFGNGKTLLRGGWGIYRFTDQYNDYTSALTTAQGLLSYSRPGGTFLQLSQVGLIPQPPAVGGVSGGINAVNPKDYGVPESKAYNFTISQQAPWRSLVEVAYVGNQSTQLVMGGESISGSGFQSYTDQNKVPLGAFFQPDPITGVISPNPESLSQGAPNNKEADYRPFGKEYSTNQINVISNDGYSNYNGLQLSWVKRSNSLTYNVNYTWSKTLGVGQQIDPFSLRGNYGLLSIDRPHVFNASYAYNFGRAYHGSNMLLSGVSNGWTLSGITTWQGGANLQAINSPNYGLSLHVTDSVTGKTHGIGSATYFGTSAPKLIMPTLTCDAGANLAHLQRINASCFGVPAVGSNGPRNYPYYRMADYFDSDLAAYKTFHITEHQNVQFRATAFNWINHPLSQFSSGNQLALHFLDGKPDGHNNSKTIGFLDTKAGGHAARIIELALKYNF